MKTFVEIGCADFDTLIPLAKKGGWVGYCVEPIPKHADYLRDKTKDLPVSVCQLAISDHDGTATMKVGQSGDSEDRWAEGASHICDSNHEGARLLELPGNVNLGLVAGNITVATERLDTFLNERGIDHIDYMKIDVEGHELNILRSYDWSVKPQLLRVEHKHLSGDEMDRILKRQGYTLHVEQDDIYAIL